MLTFTIQRGGPIFKPNPESTKPSVEPVKDTEQAEQTNDTNQETKEEK